MSESNLNEQGVTIAQGAPGAVNPNTQGDPNTVAPNVRDTQPVVNANNNIPVANQNAATVTFALTPAAANLGIIYYTTVEGRKM